MKKIQLIYFLFIFYYYHVNGQDCEHFVKINGGEIIYDRDDTISIPNGGKAILKCHASKFETASTCIDGNWDPPSLGYCNEGEQTFAVAKRQEGHHQQQQQQQSTPKHASNSGCRTLEAPSHSFLTYSPFAMAPYPTGTMANLNCFLGFSPIGQTAAECKDGEWSSIGNCQPVSVQRCPPIAPISHGMINYIPGGNGPYDYGSIAELTCGFGHSVAGNNRVTCESAGWAPAIGHCEQRKNETNAVARVKRQWGTGTNGGIGCTALMAMNGQISYVQSNPSIPYSSGTTALLICNAGFTPSGSASTYCQNGMWSPQIGQCYQNGGGFGNNGNIGTLGGLGTTSIGTLGGLGNPGSGQQQCLPIGSFVMNGQVTYSTGNPFGPFPAGSSANVQCNMGYMISGSSSAICQNGQWQPSVLGNCNPSNGGLGGIGGTQPGFVGNGAVCFGIPLPLNGQVQYSTGSQNTGQYMQGTTATLYCTSGTVSGSSFSQCSNGMWYPPIGTCNSFGGNNGFGGIGGTGGVGQCSFGMMPPLGGTIQYSTGSTFGPWQQGATATLICNGGTPLGQSTASCMNGQWQPSTFQGCNTNNGLGGIGGIGGGTGTQCYSPMPTVVGGQISYSSGSTFGPFNSGTTATLMCTNGQMPQGQTTASCQNGMWNPSMFNGCNGNNGLGGIGGIGGIGGSGQQCFASLLAPLNGQIRYSTGSTFGPFQSGTTATLTCNQGYSPQGTSSATCINGQFNPPTLGQCIQGGIGGIGGIGGGATVSNCYALPQPANGQITYTSLPQNNAYPLGTSATLTCFGGYQAMGSSSAFCQQGGWSAFVLGQCIQSNFASAVTKSSTSKEKTSESCDDSPLPLLSNGRLETTSGDPSKAKVVCHNGFSSQVSEISIFCQNGEIRTRQSAACVPPSPPSTASTTTTFAAAATTARNSGCKTPVSQVERGQILYSTGNHATTFPSGTIATLICEFGNQPIGGATMTTCVEGGWSQQLATCRPPAANNNHQCQALAKVPGGHISYSEVFNTNGPFNTGTFATLKCEFGRSLIGPATVMCRNGSWDPIGVCQNPAELPTSGGGSFLAPQRLIPPPTARCPPIKSPSLKSTLEFDQTPLADGNYPNSTIAHLICLEDNASIINGVTEAECIKGIWLPKLGECALGRKNENGGEDESDIEREEKTHLSGPGHCQPIEPPPKGKVSYIQSGAKNTYQVGSTAILNCDIGYSVSGHAALSCAPGGSWLPANGFGKCLSNTDLVH